jgi:hypothetical protein
MADIETLVFIGRQSRHAAGALLQPLTCIR